MKLSQVDAVAEVLWDTDIIGTNNEGIKYEKLAASSKDRYRKLAEAMIKFFGE